MQTNTTTALANKLAAVNKLVRLQTFTLKILEHVETHRPAPSAAQFALYPERSSAVNKVTGKHTYKTFANIKCSADQFKALDSIRN
ncbi:hypothetical protein HBI07_247890 [Parastagonospora nodorum]|nr:hypothetical protein HBI07_247890 [Parastagonospora nodorum]